MRIYSLVYGVLVFVLLMPSVNAVLPGAQYEAETPVVVGDIEVSVDVKPDTLHVRSSGRYVICYITPAEGYAARDIDVGMVTLEGVAMIPDLYGYVDINADGITELMVKFDKVAVFEQLPASTGIYPLTVTGAFLDGTTFYGIDQVHVVYR